MEVLQTISWLQNFVSDDCFSESLSTSEVKLLKLLNVLPASFIFLKIECLRFFVSLCFDAATLG